MRSFLVDAIVNEVLDGIDFEHYTIESLADHIGKHCGLIIKLVSRPTLGLTEYGYWLKGPVHDFIFYESNTARVHQEHIIMHELGHILLGHETYRVTAKSTAVEAVGLARALVRNPGIEQEAESLAAAIQQEIVRRLEAQSLTTRGATTLAWFELMDSLV